MQVLNGHLEVPSDATGAVLAIGNFDGVHRGHQALLQTAQRIGTERNAPAGVMVFEPHPREFFQPSEPHFRLTSLEDKLAIFEHLRLDLAVVMPFDAALAGMSAEAFCSDVLAGAFGARHIVIGYDFFFGKGRGGSPEVLKNLGQQLGYDATIVAPVVEDGEAFSSTAIRLKLAQGDVKGAAHALGRWWQVSGTVTGGAHRGHGLGFPTANVPLEKGTALGHGIYAVRVGVGETQLTGAAYLGTRPTFDHGKPVLEVFLFDFDGDLYGRDMTVQFIDFIRPDRKFDTSGALISQMTEDCAAARDRLDEAPERPL